MMVAVWYFAIGLIFGWCVVLLTIDAGLPRAVRAVIAAAVGAVAGYGFDFVAFESHHTAMALGGAVVGGLVASAAHELLAHGLERRVVRKEPNNL